jgi:nicotinate-nucleotide adenylyltransferase
MPFAEKIGVFGGTFDPIHLGHLSAAQNVLEQLKLNKMIFVPAGRPPHKCDRDITPSRLRYQMLQRAVVGNSAFSVSDCELKSLCVSYTVDTLKILHEKYPQSSLYLLIGFDQVLTLSTWKDTDEIFNLCQVVVMNRSGYENGKIEEEWRGKIKRLSIPLFDISASAIRDRVAQDLTIDYLVIPAVREFISENKLYRQQ